MSLACWSVITVTFLITWSSLASTATWLSTMADHVSSMISVGGLGYQLFGAARLLSRSSTMFLMMWGRNSHTVSLYSRLQPLLWATCIEPNGSQGLKSSYFLMFRPSLIHPANWDLLMVFVSLRLGLLVLTATAVTILLAAPSTITILAALAATTWCGVWYWYW